MFVHDGTKLRGSSQNSKTTTQQQSSEDHQTCGNMQLLRRRGCIFLRHNNSLTSYFDPPWAPLNLNPSNPMTGSELFQFEDKQNDRTHSHAKPFDETWGIPSCSLPWYTALK